MKNQKFKYIVILLIILILITFFYIVFLCINNVKNNNFGNSSSSDNTEETLKEYDKILSTEKYDICKVNDMSITNIDVLLTEIFDQEDTKTSKEKTIEQKVLLQEIKKENIQLNKTDSGYINDIMEGLKKDESISKHYSENEKKEILDLISEKLYNDALINQFKKDMITEMLNKTFNPTSNSVAIKYNDYLDIQRKWNTKQNISYSELTNAREEVIETYIQELKTNAKIE